jgi:hypothetical protein
LDSINTAQGASNNPSDKANSPGFSAQTPENSFQISLIEKTGSPRKVFENASIFISIFPNFLDFIEIKILKTFIYG